MNTKRPWGSFGTPEHASIGRKVAEEGIVLLKNETNLLPMNLDKIKKILVVGENAIKAMTVGGGSSSLKAKYEISPLDGIKKRIDSQAEVLFARGYVGDTSGNYHGIVSGQDLSDVRSAPDLITEAVELAKDVDLVIFIGGLNKNDGGDNEGIDRKSLGLPYGQDNLISKLAEANKNLVVINISGNAVAMPWIQNVSTIVQSWYNGTEAGNALAAILMGDINPSGKLPFSFPVKLDDIGAHSFDVNAYPGVDNEVIYKEGIFVGYRWLDKENIKPLFSFGHGLSYTTFQYGKLNADKKEIKTDDKITFSVKVKNTGNKDGAEVIQLYIRDVKSSQPRPLKELKGFKKVYLKAGEEETVGITLDKSALSYFDLEKHDWIMESGEFEALIGASVTDIKTKITFKVK